MISKLYAQLRTLSSILVKLYTPIVILVLLVVFLSLKTGIPISKFTADPAAIAGINPFIGVVSNIGILFWCASASICFFSFALLQKTRIRGNFPAFFLFSGFITSILLLDDLFLFHERNLNSREIIFPNSPFISQEVVYLSYIMLILFYLIRFRKIIIETDIVLLFLAFLFFGVSIIIDLFPIPVFDNYLFEDGFKLFGIVSWFGYFVRVCFQVVKQGILQQTENNEARIDQPMRHSIEDSIKY